MTGKSFAKVNLALNVLNKSKYIICLLDNVNVNDINDELIFNLF